MRARMRLACGHMAHEIATCAGPAAGCALCRRLARLTHGHAAHEAANCTASGFRCASLKAAPRAAGARTCATCSRHLHREAALGLRQTLLHADAGRGWRVGIWYKKSQPALRWASGQLCFTTTPRATGTRARAACSRCLHRARLRWERGGLCFMPTLGTADARACGT